MTIQKDIDVNVSICRVFRVFRVFRVIRVLKQTNRVFKETQKTLFFLKENPIFRRIPNENPYANIFFFSAPYFRE